MRREHQGGDAYGKWVAFFITPFLIGPWLRNFYDDRGDNAVLAFLKGEFGISIFLIPRSEDVINRFVRNSGVLLQARQYASVCFNAKLKPAKKVVLVVSAVGNYDGGDMSRSTERSDSSWNTK